MLSTDNVFVQPHREADKKAANAAHRRFWSRDGDLISLINIYNDWIKAKRDKVWASRNYLNFRALSHAQLVRGQLSQLVQVVMLSLSCK